ncbi:hypothetical protein [Methanosphaerula subterraneus]|uniref:hypothetical protein n=1 Tax=Methanosphaerula subterraneus TaxID=3350244 RepID=UPI003F8722C3
MAMKKMTLILMISAVLIGGIVTAGCTQESSGSSVASASNEKPADVQAGNQTGAQPAGTPDQAMMNGSRPDRNQSGGQPGPMNGTPPSGMAMNGTPPADMPMNGTRPSGTPPSGT